MTRGINGGAKWTRTKEEKDVALPVIDTYVALASKLR
jgi:hypothetical protein